MNATKRFITVLKGEIPDRVPVLVYAMEPGRVRYTIPTILLETPESINRAGPESIDTNIQAVLKRAGQVASFIVGASHPSEAILTGKDLQIESQRLETENPDYYQWRNILHTPAGDLVCANLLSDKQLPPYTKQHLFPYGLLRDQ